MPESGSTLATGIKQVTTAGTRVELPTIAAATEARAVMIQALSTNEGTIVVGDSQVVAAPGTHASPTRRGMALAAGATLSIQIIDAAPIWLDATTSLDGVSYMELIC